MRVNPFEQKVGGLDAAVGLAAKAPPAPAPVVFWSCNDGDEELRCTDTDEAVGDYLDGIGDFNAMASDREQEFRELGEITVCAWVRSKLVPDEFMAQDLLDFFFERNAEELVDPDNGPTITPGMTAAAQNLVDVIVREFEPWACTRDQAQDVKINALDWVRENAPEWLKGGA